MAITRQDNVWPALAAFAGLWSLALGWWPLGGWRAWRAMVLDPGPPDPGGWFSVYLLGPWGLEPHIVGVLLAAACGAVALGLRRKARWGWVIGWLVLALGFLYPLAIGGLITLGVWVNARDMTSFQDAASIMVPLYGRMLPWLITPALAVLLTLVTSRRGSTR